MPKVKFTQDFDFSPAEFNGRSTIAYKQDQTCTVTTECWTKAKALGKATLVPKPKKNADHEPSN